MPLFFGYRTLLPRWFALAITLASGSLAAAETPVTATAPSGARAGAILTADDDEFLEELQHAAFHYFVEQSNPVTGLVRDRARADGSPSEGKASISAEGFA